MIRRPEIPTAESRLERLLKKFPKIGYALRAEWVKTALKKYNAFIHRKIN